MQIMNFSTNFNELHNGYEQSNYGRMNDNVRWMPDGGRQGPVVKVRRDIDVDE